MRACATALATALLALAAQDAAAINKCVDKAGKVTYQEGRCPDDAKQDAFKLDPSPGPASADSVPAKAGAAPSKAEALADDPENPQLMGLASTQSTFEACSAASPEFAERHAPDLAAWRAANAALLAKAELLPSYQRLIANGREQLRKQPPGEQFARFCAVQFIPMMRKNTGK
jgi:Domain of unknown function (DUF4124)